MDELTQFLPLIIPLLLIQFTLMIIALIDLARRERTRGPKWAWVLVIILGELLGPIIYFVVGRPEE